jgi:hypothetical protein
MALPHVELKTVVLSPGEPRVIHSEVAQFFRTDTGQVVKPDYLSLTR